ncbi:MAG: deoxyhypusine synthase family protein [Deltaproteobacteria bacterium]|nr:deoxyhypusine synthase family protein [Deltaproteobacteria bacterium]
MSESEVQDAFVRAREVRPRAITGQESGVELLASAFPAFVGRQVREAARLMEQSVTRGNYVFATLSGAMTPAGLHRSCIVPLIEAGIIDVLTTTGANLYHDAHRILGHRLREIAPDAGDTMLREARIIRIYDIGFAEDVLLKTDRLFSWLVAKPDFQRSMTTAEFHNLLGQHLYEIELALGVDQHSLLATAYKHGVPIFVGAPQDGSIFLNVVKLKALLGEEFKFSLDVAADVYQMAGVQWLAQTEGETAVWILGGGVPKNYTLQGEPTLSQIFELDARGFDIDVQFCVDPVDNGALSSCPAGEGHTWGKVSAECVEYSSVYVHCDVTAVFPWLVHALFQAGVRREPRRMMDRLAEARQKLDADVAERRDALLAGLHDTPEELRAPTAGEESSPASSPTGPSPSASKLRFPASGGRRVE